MLSQSQLGFFARNGYLQISGLIDRGACEKLVEHTWTRLPPHWSREDPLTWSGSLPDSCHVADLHVRRGLLQFQKGDLLGDPVVEGAFASSAICGELARTMIGHALAKMRLRGLYCIVPLPASISYKGLAKPHIESHPTQLVALCYLEDVVPGGGGLHVWPGSHRDIYPAMGSKLEHVATRRYDEVFEKWANLMPIELPGVRGDIVIIHHRLLHAPSLNRSAKIRYGFLCDYQRTDFRALCTMAPGADMWEDWPAILNLPQEVRDAPPDVELRQQQGYVDAVPVHSRSYRLSVSHTSDADASSIRKADASALARARRVEDVWVAISDNPVTANDPELFPRGSNLSAAGLSIKIDGKVVQSVCLYDFICRIDNSPGEHVIEIEGFPATAWLRILKIRLPFVRTEFLLKIELSPGAQLFAFTCPAE